MHPQLQTIIDDYRAATARFALLRTRLPAERWPLRCDPARWSAAECVAHLNLTARVYLPEIETALAAARALGAPPPRRYRRDLVGWLLYRTVGPPARYRVKAPAPFVPEGAAPIQDLWAEFERLQAAQIDLVHEADGLAIDRVRVVSPFSVRIRYNLYACLTILPRHEHRHLWQAEEVWGGGVSRDVD
jgi:hypothetical protein